MDKKELFRAINVQEKFINIDYSTYRENITDTKLLTQLDNIYNNKDKLFNRNNSVGLYLQGGFGSGKTCFANILLKELVWDKYINGYFYTYSMLINKFNEYIQNYSDYNYFFIKLCSYDLLVIDDFGSFSIEDTKQLAFLEELIRNRAAGNKQMIYTSNKDINTLGKSFNEAIFSLLKETIYVVKFPSTDFRNNIYEQNKLYVDTMLQSSK